MTQNEIDTALTVAGDIDRMLPLGFARRTLEALSAAGYRLVRDEVDHP